MSSNRALNNRENIDNTFLIKLVFVGDSGVGKTSLLNREAQDTFTEKHLATIGVDFRIKIYDLGIVKIKAQMWDTAGQERFRSIQKPYYKNAKAVCLCFALDDRQSFQNLDHWLKDIESMDVPRQNMILIGCKSDKQVTVATDQILVYAQSNKVQYHQTSAKQNQGVNQAFRSIMIRAAEKQISNLRNQPVVPDLKQEKMLDLKQEKPSNKKGCC